MVLGACRKKGWRPEQTRVVDLMAGTGVLSVALKAAGFEKTKAIEACAEMLPGGSSDVEFVDRRSFANIRGALEEIRPQVIVSLAGFHHLIERTGKGVDRLRSVAAQAILAGACVDALDPGGLLLVVDIAEDDDFGQLGIDGMNDWDGYAFKSLRCGGDELRADLIATNTIVEYEAALKARFGELSLDGLENSSIPRRSLGTTTWRSVFRCYSCSGGGTEMLCVSRGSDVRGCSRQRHRRHTSYCRSSDSMWTDLQRR